MPTKAQLRLERRQGEVLGMQLNRQESDSPFVVTSVVAGSAAEQAGVRCGDVVISVNRVPLADKSAADVMGLLRGDADTQVLLKVVRFSDSECAEMRKELETLDTVSGQAHTGAERGSALAELANDSREAEEGAAKDQGPTSLRSFPCDSSGPSSTTHELPPTAGGSPGTGAIAGVGIAFTENKRNNTLIVKSLAPGGPAEASGLVSIGDILLKVDGKDVDSTDAASRLILGSCAFASLLFRPARCVPPHDCRLRASALATECTAAGRGREMPEEMLEDRGAGVQPGSHSI